MSEVKQSKIDVQQAILIAKKHVGDLFSTDQVKNIGLEEVSLDENEDCWSITIGFSRPWDTAPLQGGGSLSFLYPDAAPRTYKIVTIYAIDGTVKQVANRPV